MGLVDALALLTSGALLLVDSACFIANLLKVAEGGWIPLTLGVMLFVVMTTWHAGIEAVRNRMATMTEPSEQFLKRLQQDTIARVPGTAVFLTRLADGRPALLIENVAQIGAWSPSRSSLRMCLASVRLIGLRWSRFLTISGT